MSLKLLRDSALGGLDIWGHLVSGPVLCSEVYCFRYCCMWSAQTVGCWSQHGQSPATEMQKSLWRQLSLILSTYAFSAASRDFLWGNKRLRTEHTSVLLPLRHGNVGVWPPHGASCQWVIIVRQRNFNWGVKMSRKKPPHWRILFSPEMYSLIDKTQDALNSHMSVSTNLSSSSLHGVIKFGVVFNYTERLWLPRSLW